jgi:hypothetical protein
MNQMSDRMEEHGVGALSSAGLVECCFSSKLALRPAGRPPLKTQTNHGLSALRVSGCRV